MDATNYVEALVTHYPDLCERIVHLQGIGDLPQALAADRFEAERLEATLVAVCQDFQKRVTELTRVDASDAEIHHHLAVALTTALGNVFGLGVWLGASGLARFPKPVESKYSDGVGE
jgi:hypothetical protein